MRNSNVSQNSFSGNNGNGNVSDWKKSTAASPREITPNYGNSNNNSNSNNNNHNGKQGISFLCFHFLWVSLLLNLLSLLLSLLLLVTWFELQLHYSIITVSLFIHWNVQKYRFASFSFYHSHFYSIVSFLFCIFFWHLWLIELFIQSLSVLLSLHFLNSHHPRGHSLSLTIFLSLFLPLLLPLYLSFPFYLSLPFPSYFSLSIILSYLSHIVYFPFSVSVSILLTQ